MPRRIGIRVKSGVHGDQPLDPVERRQDVLALPIDVPVPPQPPVAFVITPEVQSVIGQLLVALGAIQ